MLDAEPMLFIHDEQSEVLEPHVLRQHTVGAYDDIYGPGSESPQHYALLGRRPKA